MERGAFASKWRIDDDGRECSMCERYKDWEEFAPSSAKQPHGRQSACRDCRSEKYPTRHRKGEHRPWKLAKFGLTPEDYSWLLELQAEACALCLRPETRSDYRCGDVWSLSVDHDHRCHPAHSGCKSCIRGLLCADCNLLLGLAERVGGLVVARFSDYLERRPFR
jgi:Recombination endonuclease VII